MKEKILLCTFLIVITINAQAQNGTPYWSLAGNSNATPSSKPGTINYTALNLATNNVPRVYIAPNGFVGIGTSNPTAQLHVEGQTLLNIFVNTVAPGLQSGSGLIGYVKGQPTAAGQRLGYFLTGSQGGGTNAYNATGMVGYADGAWSSTSKPAYVAFETTKPGALQRSEAMRISSNGLVGIGTKTPNYRLHVVDSAGIAIYTQGLGSNGYGLYASAGYLGVYASGGTYGVFATGIFGLYGSGSDYGVYGYGTSRGVYGAGQTGIYGLSSDNAGDAVMGVASGTNCYGANFQSTSSYGVFAYTGNSASYAGYFSGSIYSTGTYQGSDKRLKKNITDFTDAVSIIKKLKPKIYEYQTDGKFAEMNLPKGKHYGLIAQELETVLPDLVKETSQNPHRDTTAASKRSGASSSSQETFKAVNYTELIPILIKGMQEQDEKLQEVAALKDEIQQLKATVQELKSMLSNNSASFLSSTSLEVPVPNPANSSTNFRYSIPAGVVSARLTVVNILGQVMKEVKLSGSSGQVNLNVSNLASGSYPCTLWVNGQATVSMQLVVAH